MVAVLAALGGFLYVRLGAELLRGTDLELRYRAGVVAAALSAAPPGTVGVRADVTAAPVDTGRSGIDPDEAFAQVLSDDGRVIAASGAARDAPPLLPRTALAGLRGATFLTRRVPGLDDPARLLAVPVPPRGSAVVVGANLGDQREALDRLRLLLLVAGPGTLLLACAAGWLVAGAALRPVEQLRREAAAISRGGPDRRLTVPATRDELARLAGTLNALLAAQQDALGREHRFVDLASHELRTPLAVLRAELDLALARPRERAQLAAALRAAATQTERLVRLAEELLVLARSRPDGLPRALTTVQLGALLRDSVTAVEGRAEAAGCRVTLQSAVPEVRADPVRLRQAVDNLLDNALRYAAGTAVEVSARRQDGAVVIGVADGGPGWPPGVGDRVFEPFVRGGREPVSGAGLGLAVVRAVAEAHGGLARAATAPGGGAVVELVLPG